MPGAVVALVPTGRRENLALYRCATTDAAGAFTIRRVAPGEHKIFVWETTPSGAYYNAEFLKKYEDSGRAVTIAPDSKLRTDLTVIR